ncbi:MAG TPA: M23 family metallopeptidase [Ferruginibacter sp.]|nr:M23 family metallopeptidase [Ferruginibacter sp.]
MKNLLLLFTLAGLSVSASSFTPIEKNPVKPGANKLVYPVSGKKSKVGGFFGDYRNGGRSHKGVDIYAKRGTPVVAICDGIITSTATEKLGGKTIRLKAADYTWSAYYAHLDKLNVRVGQYVQKGETIGTIGNTGNAKRKAAHLHFGIYGGGRAVNPLPYVKNSKKILNPGPVASNKKNNKKTGQPQMVSRSLAGDKEPVKTNTLNTRMPGVQTTGMVPGEPAWKKIRVYQDAKGSYYVTRSMNVVRMENGNTKTIGKWKNQDDEEYPAYITLKNKKLLYIYKDGTILSQAGDEIGAVN